MTRHTTVTHAQLNDALERVIKMVLARIPIPVLADIISTLWDKKWDAEKSDRVALDKICRFAADILNENAENQKSGEKK